MKLFTMVGTGAAVALLAGGALAQEANAQASTNGGVGVSLPGATAPAADSDHSQMVGRFAVGYLGRQNILAGDGQAAPQLNLVAPVIGVRYWLDNMIGIDAGLGFNFSSGSTEAGGTSTDKPGVTVLMFHGGVPINLADAGHFSFQIVPEATLGFASVGDSAPMAAETTRSGFLLNVGARAGAEIHFGFMGIPQLSLQGSVGAYLRHQSAGTETVVAGTTTEFSDSSLTIGTTLGNNPWDIFTGGISAFYYF
jgi:hypothetical protein